MRDGPPTYVLYPFFGILLSLIIAGAGMSLSSVSCRTEVMGQFQNLGFDGSSKNSDRK